MKNQTELKKMMWDVQNEITTMKENLKNSKDYLIYLNDCLKEIQKQEAIETPQQRECQILFNKWIQGKL